MSAKHLISIRDWSGIDVAELLRLSAEMKRSADSYREALAGKTLGMIFEKPSTRTRVSFEVGIYQLGGVGLYLSGSDLQLGRGETLADTAKVLSRYVDGVMARFGAHADVVELARHATVPVINGLSDLFHPCQALADYFTLLEKKHDLKGRKIAYVGDGGCNTANSTMIGCSSMGMGVTVVCPDYPKYSPSPEILSKIEEHSGSEIAVSHDPLSGVAEADVIYTDVWVSAGMEEEKRKRMEAFPPFQVNTKLVSKAKPDCIVMHCLPAHRGYEITDEVLDSGQSVVFDQAGNRMHAQNGLLYRLLKK